LLCWVSGLCHTCMEGPTQANVGSMGPSQCRTLVVFLSEKRGCAGCWWCWVLVVQERGDFRELVLADTSKSLTHIFFAQRLTTKVTNNLKPFRDLT